MARFIYFNHFKDRSGNVISSGTVSVYLNGTTTAASVYVASSGGTAVNSVTSDASGLFYFYVDTADYNANQKFKLILSKTNFNSQTYDDIVIYPEHEYVYYADASATDQGVDSNDNSLKDLLTEIGTSDERTIVLKQGTYTVSTNLTITSNITLKFQAGAIFTIGNGITLTVNGNVEAGLYQIFSGAGTVTGLKVAYPEWWGIDGTSDEDEINKAIASVGSSKGDVYLQPSKTYTTDGTINIDGQDRVRLIGGGQQSTVISFSPASAIPAIKLFRTGGASTVAQNVIKGFAIDANGNTQDDKVGILIVDAEEVILEDIAISNFTSTSVDSIGIQFQGRQTHTIRNLTIAADIPILIDANPYNSIDADHYHFQDIYLTAANTQPCVKISSGVNLTHVTFDGYQAWTTGKWGLYWVDTATTAASLSLTIKNVRWEQQPAVGYFIYISHNYELQQLILENLYGGGLGNGFYLRKVRLATLDNIFYTGGAGTTGMDIDSTNTEVSLNEVRFNDSATTISLTATKLHGFYRVGSLSNRDTRILPQVNMTTATLTATQVKGLASGGGEITLVPAHGAGTWIEFISASIHLNYSGTGNWAEPSSPDDLVIEYANGTDTSAAITANGFITATEDESRYVVNSLTTNQSLDALLNQGLQIKNSGSNYTDNAGTPTSTLTVITTYRVHYSGL